MVEVMFLEGRYRKDINLEPLKRYIEENFDGKVAVYASVQFLRGVDKLRQELDNEVVTSRPRRAFYEGQLLGCDSFGDSLNLEDEVGLIVYIGDGEFHPYALLFSQEHFESYRPVVVYNPVNGNLREIGMEEIERKVKKRRGNLMRFYDSSVIGVFISSKWGQEFTEWAEKLQSMYPEKSFYYFMGDLFDGEELENFPFVECWVNTACPRIAQENTSEIGKPVVNIRDVWNDS